MREREGGGREGGRREGGREERREIHLGPRKTSTVSWGSRGRDEL